MLSVATKKVGSLFANIFKNFYQEDPAILTDDKKLYINILEGK